MEILRIFNKLLHIILHFVSCDLHNFCEKLCQNFSLTTLPSKAYVTAVVPYIPNNTKKYMTFSIDTKTKYYDKNADKIKNKVLHELMFIASLQFMSSSLSQLVNNLTRRMLRLVFKERCATLANVFESF